MACYHDFDLYFNCVVVSELTHGFLYKLAEIINFGTVFATRAPIFFSNKKWFHPVIYVHFVAEFDPVFAPPQILHAPPTPRAAIESVTEATYYPRKN